MGLDSKNNRQQRMTLQFYRLVRYLLTNIPQCLSLRFQFEISDRLEPPARDMTP